MGEKKNVRDKIDLMEIKNRDNLSLIEEDSDLARIRRATDRVCVTRRICPLAK